MTSPLSRRLRNWLVAGTLVVVPLVSTWLILRVLFHGLDSWLMPSIIRLAEFFGYVPPPGFRIPGVGIAATIVTIILAGILTTNLIGRRLVALGELLLTRIPLVSSVYFASKQLVEVFSAGEKAFREVVLVEFPRTGLWSIGFITNDLCQVYKEGEPPMYPVFIPHTPLPTTGFLIMAGREAIFPLPISVEEGIKFIVSGGILAPAIKNPAKFNLTEMGPPAMAGGAAP